MIQQQNIYKGLRRNLSEISRLEKDIRKKAFSNLFLIKEMGIRCVDLNEKVRACQIKASDYTVPFLASEELIKMLRPVGYKYNCLMYSQFVDTLDS